MNTRPTTKRGRGQRGFILATVLIFLIVLSLTAFLAAKLTRTDIQVVNNLQNEKEAFAIAEAGIHEAFYRMNVAIGDRATVGGQTFNASLAPIVPGRSAPAGVTSYGIDSTNTQFTSQVIFTTNAPTTGTNNVVPTLQPASLQIPYSFSTADTVTPVDLGSTARLTIGWDVCVNGTDPGCSAAGAIRKLPLSSPRFVAKIVSTGRSGTATRKITAQAVDCIPSQSPGNGSIVTLDQGCSGGTGGAQLNGGNSITAAGNIQINAGALYNPPSQCNAAGLGGNTSFMHAQSIHVAGSTSGNGNFTPAAATGALPTSDPYSNLVRPCYTGGPSPCQGTTVTTVRNGAATSPATYTVNTNGATIQPGIYYGGIDIRASNVTMASGYYMIVGGGLSVGNNASVFSASGGVMIFNTLNNAQGCSGALCNAGSLSLDNGNTSPNFTAISDPNDPFDGVVFFQERAPTLPLTQPQLSIQGGGVGRALDGLVYAPDANLHVYGSNVVNTAGALIVKSMDFQGNSGLSVQNAANPPPPTLCAGIGYQIIAWQDF